MIILHRLRHLRPEILPSLQKRKGGRDGQIGNGGGVAEAKPSFLQVHVRQDREVLGQELREVLLGPLLANLHAEDAVCDVGDARVYASLSPVHDHVYLSPHLRIGGVQLFASGEVHSEVTKDGVGFPDGAGIVTVEFEGRKGVARVNLEEFLGAGLSVGIYDFDIGLEVPDYGDASVRVGGCDDYARRND